MSRVKVVPVVSTCQPLPELDFTTASSATGAAASSAVISEASVALTDRLDKIFFDKESKLGVTTDGFVLSDVSSIVTSSFLVVSVVSVLPLFSFVTGVSTVD
ncbi:hypothetical protein [Companilactobacillus kimchiensis]|uniref:hypothetical protein n=1 Tax=Companilactobacillus kimchiensis TaxID=993692 RepID=UPI00070CDA00|nr:hypothetical protein [Companilactobacillus kimchiensis]